MQALLQAARAAGIRFEVTAQQFRVIAPPGALTEELRNGIQRHKEAIKALLMTGDEVDALEIPADPSQQHQPFPLTDLQHAYWIGRGDSLDMGRVATHYYLEIEGTGLDPDRLNAALNRLIRHQGMLRAIVTKDGHQRILPDVPPYSIALTDLSDASPDEQRRSLAATRDALSHQVREPDQWPLFEIRATRLPEDRLRLHLSFDLLILDALSLSMLFRDWQTLYQTPDTPLPELTLSFRDYVLAAQNRRNDQARTYWMNRLDSLPGAPELPLRTTGASSAQPRFKRREHRLEKERWAPLKQCARELGLTPSALLLTLYAAVLARWSSHPHFCLNITVSDRPQEHPDLQRLYGDFTTTLLHEVDFRNPGLSLADRARGVQAQFARDLAHKSFSGIAVLRELARQQGSGPRTLMPVVFTSGLIWKEDEELGNDFSTFGEKVFNCGQTSQVWLDHFVSEYRGDLVLSWDVCDEKFPEGVPDAMFTTYITLLNSLAENIDWSQPLRVDIPPEQLRQRQATPLPYNLPAPTCLHQGFVQQAQSNPHHIALITPERTLTYGELLGEACALADRLLQRGVQSNSLVAILMHKGWEQWVAVYGILLAGAAYLPISATLPPLRQKELLSLGKVRHLVTQADTDLDADLTAQYECHRLKAGPGTPFRSRHAHSVAIQPDRLAYVIFTSGTTGTPKGVMMSHGAAANTLADINRRFDVGPHDRVLAVSSLSFDLSVYDGFGLLAAGGTLVMPEAGIGQDPLLWRDLIARHSVTLWNSAPQLMNALVDSLSPGDTAISTLRTVLLSGDWIPLDLPERIHRFCPEAQIVSLGGATEAAVWSIAYPIDRVDPDWRSIPYGKALTNQSVQVLNDALEPCPDHVKGRIYIGGRGLATGYWDDAEKTAERFIHHPVSGERLYDTGDLGCYAPDGNILMLGRDDHQIKLRGHRIELGEIESVLARHPAIRQVVVDKVTLANGRDQLVAFLVPADMARPDPADLNHFLKERLPRFMVPHQWVTLDHIPLSPNGKVDRAQLHTHLVATDSEGPVAPRNEIERILLACWRRVMPDGEPGVTDNFFEMGGDSLSATLLIREVNEALPVPFEVHELFEAMSIEALADLYQHKVNQSVAMNDNAEPDLSFIQADIDRTITRFDTFDFQSPARPVDTTTACFITGASGWIGRHLVAELLATTEATLYCLLRPSDPDETLETATERLMAVLYDSDLPVNPAWRARLQPVFGDLTRPAFGLSDAQWYDLAAHCDRLFHFGASLNLMPDYATLAPLNVHALAELVRFATTARLKPVVYCSPMTVCRRGTRVYGEEQSPSDAQGLGSGYAQTKWAAEQVLLNARERGLPVTLYRTSHALPSHQGRGKTNSSYQCLFETACLAGAVPDWPNSSVGGLPVDQLCRLMVANGLTARDYEGLIHLENRHPLSLPEAIRGLLDLPDHRQPAPIPMDVWKRLCLEAASQLPPERAALAKRLFTGQVLEKMFEPHDFSTANFDHWSLTGSLDQATPQSYWQRVGRQIALGVHENDRDVMHV